MFTRSDSRCCLRVLESPDMAPWKGRYASGVAQLMMKPTFPSDFRVLQAYERIPSDMPRSIQEALALVP